MTSNNALAQELEARAVISKLVMCARTSGGTAGPDKGLIEACEDGEMWLAKYPCTPARGIVTTQTPKGLMIPGPTEQRDTR